MRRWHETLGGPFVVVATDRLAHWRGADEDEEGTTDYERACAVHTELGVLATGAGDVLVLGRDPRATTPIAVDGISGFARWMHAENEDRAEQLIAGLSLATLPAPEQQLAWRVTSPSVSLFDAAYAGGGVTQRVETSLAPGDYDVTAHLVEPDDKTSFTIVLLRPV